MNGQFDAFKIPSSCRRMSQNNDPLPTAIVRDTRGGTLIPIREAVQAHLHQK